MADNKKKKKTGIGLAVWLLVAIVLLIIFLVKWETIHNNLVNAGLIKGELIEKTEKPEKPEKTATTKKSEKKSKKDDIITLKVQDGKIEEQKPIQEVNVNDFSDKLDENTTSKTFNDTENFPATDNIPNEVVSDNATSVEKIEPIKPEKENLDLEKSAKKPNADVNSTTEKQNAVKSTEALPKPTAKVDLKLCFIVIDADGTLNYKIVTRSVEKTDSPLTTAINLVLEGPIIGLGTEKNCTSLIPDGTKLLGATVSNGVATLNFNDAFEINPEGMEGYIAQLKQIIFTATQFSTVKSVQFLIEGKKVDYLGSDGVWIGTPLNRTSF